jgi:hypothetical protein
MKCRIIVFVITILCFAAITVAQPQIPTSVSVGSVLGSDTDKSPSERELLCSDLVAFAFSESRDRQAQSRDSSTQNAGLLWARGYSTTGHTSPPVEPRRNQSRGLARLDRAQRDHQTIQEQIVVLYNICKSTYNSIEVEN